MCSADVRLTFLFTYLEMEWLMLFTWPMTNVLDSFSGVRTTDYSFGFYIPMVIPIVFK